MILLNFGLLYLECNFILSLSTIISMKNFPLVDNNFHSIIILKISVLKNSPLELYFIIITKNLLLDINDRNLGCFIISTLRIKNCS